MVKNILKTQYIARNRRLRTRDITYLEFLKSDIWKETKDYVKQFIEFQSCVICGSKHRLNIHHMTYTRMFDPRLKIRKQGLTCLCYNCHNEIHKLAQEKNYGLRQAIKKYRKSLK